MRTYSITTAKAAKTKIAAILKPTKTDVSVIKKMLGYSFC